MNIDYKLLGKAADYYSFIGYRQIEVPWLVTEMAKNITCPTSKDRVPRGLYNIDSGEQGFLELVLACKTTVGDKLFTITPCYRPYDEQRSAMHKGQFVKLELFHRVSKNYKEPVDNMAREAMILFETLGIPKHLLITCLQEPEKRHGCIEMHCVDITCNFAEIELGSYGLRRGGDVGTWVYGTGLALPRYQMAKDYLEKMK